MWHPGHLLLPLLFAAASCGHEATAPIDIANDVMAPSAEANARAEPTEAALTAEGWGPLRIGMTRAEIVAAAGPDADPEAVGGPEPDRCDQFRPARAPEGLLVMVEDDRLTRISIHDNARLRTSDGIGIGMAAADAKTRLGNAARISPHHYVEAPAEYIDHWVPGTAEAPYVQDPAARGVRYEIGGDGRVGAIHAGGPSIQYVEGCA